MKIAGRSVGRACDPYIVAEIGASHGGYGNFNGARDARRLLHKAKHAGADAAKIQFYNPQLLAEQRGGVATVIQWQGEDITLLDLYAKAFMPSAWMPELFEEASRIDLPLFSSVFHVDDSSIPMLYAWGAVAYKISSYEVADLALIRKAASSGLPILISTGDRDLKTISDAYVAATEGGALDIAILHCVSKYPCPTQEANVDRICELRKQFSVVGFSDHTLGNEAAIAAVHNGAAIIEKHIKLDGDTTSPDADFAIEPQAFKDYVRVIRAAHQAMKEAA